MSFIRPEVAAGFLRWRETISWALTLGVGLWLFWRGWAVTAPLLLVAGAVLIAAGAALLRPAWRRARRLPEIDEGLVAIDEARIAYMGPREGGFIDLPDLARVEVTAGPGGRVWVLTDAEGDRLVIPFGARGAGQMFDALTALPGIDLDRSVRPDAIPGGRSVTLWRRSG